MQKKDIAYVIIIQFLISKPKGECTIGEIYNKFGIYPDGKGGYENRGSNDVTQRGIARYVNELLNMGILKVTNKKYSISDNMFVLKSITEKKALNDLINTLIEAKKSYILKTMEDVSEKHSLNNKTVECIMDRISNNIESDDIDEEKEYIIQKAILNSSNIRVTYNSKLHDISPIAIVNNSAGTKKYLFYLYKGKLLEPFVLSKITSVELLNRNFVKNKKFIDDIIDRWDIEGGKDNEVKIIFEKEIVPEVIMKLECRKKGIITYDNEKNLVYEDRIRGIDDFKKWLRPYIKYCKIIKPKFLRKNLLEKSKMKLERYMEI